MFRTFSTNVTARPSDLFQQTSKVLTVAELTRSIRGTLETKFARGLGAGRNLELQTASDRSSVFHTQGSARPDRMRDFARHDAAAATAAGRWSTGAGLRHRHSFRSARTISAQRSDSFSRAESAYSRQNSKRSSANSKPKDYLLRNGNGRCRNFRGGSGSSLHQAARLFATC